VLPLNESTINLQKPALRPLEKWEQGYNNILLPRSANSAQHIAEAELSEAADVLRLRPTELNLILSLQTPLPLARAATMDEASLVQRRLAAVGIDTHIVSDAQLGTDAAGPVKLRSFDIDVAGVYGFQTPEAPSIQLMWKDFILLVVGRLTVKRVELKEQKGVRAENRILDASEFATDETVVDLYTNNQAVPYRIAANSFDFSCLEENKALLASENIATLLKLIREHAPHAEYDDSFQSARKALEVVWPSDQQNESSGWRRERP